MKLCEACNVSAPDAAHSCPSCGGADWRPLPAPPKGPEAPAPVVAKLAPKK